MTHAKKRPVGPDSWRRPYDARPFHTRVRAPANIAWVKYWGKKGPQLPANPSLSMTLRECATVTELEATPAPQLDVELWFAGAREESFERKTRAHLGNLAELYPLLGRFRYKITSDNTFPHSSGIASSASSQAALALALGRLLQAHAGGELPLTEVGSMARLGSGSACRSLHGGFVAWGESARFGSSDLHANPINEHVHPDFKQAQDTVLVVSSRQKEVPSRAGHGQMSDHPFAQARFQQAGANFDRLADALQSGDWSVAGEVMEEEALTLHALMLAGRPGYVLLEPNSLEIIRLVRLFRRESGVPLYFTIDAGPNIHLVYPESALPKVGPFVRHELLRFTEQGQGAIWDRVGEGPE